MATMVPFGEVYVHTCIVNGKSYVGQTTAGVSKRWYDQVKTSRDARRAGFSYPVSRAIRKYGNLTFEHQILAGAQSKPELDNLEKVWIILLQTRNDVYGYNLAAGGEGNPGLKHTPEAKAKISLANMGNRHCIGRPCSDETRARMSIKRAGMVLSPEWRENIAAASRGRKHLAATKVKIAAANKGKQVSAETRKKMGDASRGNTRCLGRKYGPETLAKIAARPRDIRGHFLKAQVSNGA